MKILRRREEPTDRRTDIESWVGARIKFQSKEPDITIEGTVLIGCIYTTPSGMKADLLVLERKGSATSSEEIPETLILTKCMGRGTWFYAGDPLKLQPENLIPGKLRRLFSGIRQHSLTDKALNSYFNPPSSNPSHYASEGFYCKSYTK